MDKRKKQRLMGALMLLACGIMLWLCSTGATPEDRDITAAVLLVPLGLWMLFSKKDLIY